MPELSAQTYSAELSVSVIIITTALQVPTAIFTESYLSFLGLGVSGTACLPWDVPGKRRQSRHAVLSLLRLVIPAIAICLIALALNLLGDGLRDAFRPEIELRR